MIGHVKRRARTSHDCNVCGGTIFYGEDYIRSVDLEREVRDRATGRRKVSARTARAHLRCSDAPECVATRRADAQRIVDAWNLAHPIGTPVTYWSWTRDVAGRESQTRTAAQLNGAHQPVVWVEGEPGCIALSHVDAWRNRVAEVERERDEARAAVERLTALVAAAARADRGEGDR